MSEYIIKCTDARRKRTKCLPSGLMFFLFQFLSLPRMKRSQDDRGEVKGSRKFPLSTSQQFNPRTSSSSQNYAIDRENLTYSTIGKYV